MVVLATLIACVEKNFLDKLINIQALGIYAVHLQKGVFNYEV